MATTTPAMTVDQKLAAARFLAGKRMPYFTSALHHLVPVAVPGLGTVGVTDSGRMLFDPACVERWTVAELAAVYLHEIGHVLQLHSKRAKAVSDCNHKVWNKAGDCAINVNLRDAGLTLPNFVDEHGAVVGKPCFPGDFGLADGEPTEVYYRELMKQQPAAGSGPSGGPTCGSGAGNPLPGEPEAEAGADADGLPRRTEIDRNNVIARTAEAIRNAEASGVGSIPQNLLRWAEATLAPPVVPWQEKLARATRAAVAFKRGAVDYTYARPARRQAALGYGARTPILPSMRAPVPHVAVAFDTSASVGAAELRDGLTEVAGVLAALGTSAIFMACDAELHDVATVRSVQDCLPHLKGGGGTSFVPVFDALARMRPRPSILVYVTDGCGPAPHQQPAGLHVIWLLVGPYQQTPCPWGEVIGVPYDRKP